MAIHEKIKKLVKTLGGVPKSDTIEGAVDDLVGLFTEKREVKMVEIVPEMTIDAQIEYGDHSVRGNIDDFNLVDGRKYKVIFNGVEYKCIAENIEDTVLIGSSDENYTEYPFTMCNRREDVLVIWPMPKAREAFLPYSCVVAIYEEQETVTPPAVALPRVEKKMVAIVPEQSFIGEPIPSEVPMPFDFGAQHSPISAGLSIEKEYSVLINGETYKATVTDSSVAGIEMLPGMLSLEILNKDNSVIFGTYAGEFEGQSISMCTWKADLGETITLAIYEEQEIVKPLDPKFVGASGDNAIVIKSMEYDNVHTCNKTFNELLAIAKSNPIDLTNGRIVVLYDNPYDFYMAPISRAICKNADGDFAANDSEIVEIEFEYNGTSMSGFFIVTANGVTKGSVG